MIITTITIIMQGYDHQLPPTSMIITILFIVIIATIRIIMPSHDHQSPPTSMIIITILFILIMPSRSSLASAASTTKKPSSNSTLTVKIGSAKSSVTGVNYKIIIVVIVNNNTIIVVNNDTIIVVNNNISIRDSVT